MRKHYERDRNGLSSEAMRDANRRVNILAPLVFLLLLAIGYLTA